MFLLTLFMNLMHPYWLQMFDYYYYGLLNLHIVYFGLKLTQFGLFLSPVNYDMSTAKELLLLANSTEEQQKWVSRLVRRVPRKPIAHSLSIATASPPSEASPASLSPQPSPHLSARSPPRLSHRGAIKVHSTRQPPSPKTRWEPLHRSTATYKDSWGRIVLHTVNWG